MVKTTSAFSMMGKRLLALASPQGEHGKLRREALRLRLPIGQHARRRNDQRGLVEAALRLFERKERERLHRLAEAHIVRENAAKFHLAQEIEPGQPVALIGTKLRLERSRRRHRLWAAPLT